MKSKLKEKFNLYTPIRASSVVFPFGVGSMMDLPDMVLMTAACDYWDGKKLTSIHDERLEKVLKVRGFKSPVCKNSELNDVYIPLVQFPKWLFCPKCRRFKPLKEWEQEGRELLRTKYNPKKNICPRCKIQLSPSRIVTACKHGHINDFPWIQWVHYKNGKKVCDSPEIYIKTNGSSSGLEGIKIECKTCNSKATLKGAFDKDGKVFEVLEKKAQELGILVDDESLKCKGEKPWEGKFEKCNIYPQTLQRGATNIYFPKVETSILIPPYSEKINKKIENSEKYEKLLTIIEDLKEDNSSIEKINEKIDSYCKKIADDIDEDILAIRKILDRKLNNTENNIENKTEYKEEEYKAIVRECEYDVDEQSDFKTEIINKENFQANYIKKVVLIHKMREIRVLTGFSRINSMDSNLMEQENTEEATLVRTSSEKRWYPAIEVNGEGIFIEFNEDLIRKWIKSDKAILGRANVLNERYKEILLKRGHSIREITPKFLLLHTLSHLLIKEMSFKCGYNSTSLKERIYCNSDNSYNMSGILIYTANGDSEGTLGGLVRQGREDRLEKIIDRAVEKAKFCSSDPVCIESKGQGRDALNLASCYSCTLVAETSCEEFNTLLDRAMIVGTFENNNIGFFNYINTLK